MEIKLKSYFIEVPDEKLNLFSNTKNKLDKNHRRSLVRAVTQDSRLRHKGSRSKADTGTVSCRIQKNKRMDI